MAPGLTTSNANRAANNKIEVDMMKSKLPQVLAFVVIAGVLGQAFADDVNFSRVDRSILREPAWKTGKPRYCLFVMLKDDAWDYVIPGETELGLSVVGAERRVWFVLDGDDLYMDINENGDLTDPGEKLSRLEMGDEERRKVNNQSLWQIPDIRDTDGEPLITNIQFNPRPGKRAPVGSTRVCFSAPGRRDVCADPILSDKPANAPIVHVIGLYHLSLSVRKTFLSAQRTVSNVFHVDGHLYLEPLGPGSHYALETSGLDCRIEYPLTDGTIKVKEFRLQNYITGPYQTASARLPENVDDEGTVRITLSHQGRRPPVIATVIEKRPTELRAVRRKK